MDHLERFVTQVRTQLFVMLLVNNVLIIAAWWVAQEALALDPLWVLAAMGATALLSFIIIPLIATKFITEPTRLIWQAILHIAPDVANVPAPDLSKPVLGRELVTYLTSHIYQLASVVDSLETDSSQHADLPKTL